MATPKFRSQQDVVELLTTPYFTAHNAPVKKIKHSWFTRHFSGWRFGVCAGAAASLAVLIINVGVGVYAGLNVGFKDGRGVIFEGSCQKARSLNTAAHLVINILGTILLGASNYTMQILTAPTRADVDRAHQRHRWLEIGVHSLRNLGNISWWRYLFWAILACSSVPLHLFYNSSVFSSLAKFEVAIVSVGDSFLMGASLSNSSFTDDELEFGDATFIRLLQADYVAGNFTRLDNAACIDTYSKPFESEYGHVLLAIAPEDNEDDKAYIDTHYADRPPNGPTSTGNNPDIARWVCGGTQEYRGESCEGEKLATVRQNATNWRPYGRLVENCYAQTTQQHCKVQLSKHLLLAVIVFNAVKTVAMLATILFVKVEPLLNIGDALASFLERKDETTKNIGLASKADVVNSNGDWLSVSSSYGGSARRWFTAASVRRWVVVYTMYALAIALCIFFLIWGIVNIPVNHDTATIRSIGFGAVDARMFIKNWKIPNSGISGLIANTLIVNIAQLVLSFLYFAYNSLFTCMLQALEWSSFVFQQKPLRVTSKPLGQQRTSHFLQLPYRYALPLMTMSGVLHWLVSQSIFLVSIDIYTRPDRYAARSEPSTDLLHDPDFDVLTCGYSPLAIAAVIGVGSLMALFGLGMGMRKFPKGSPPTAGACSAVFSATCHESRESDLHLKPVQLKLQ